MLGYVWPMALIVISNTVYQICAKSQPEGLNPFASLVVTYGVSALVSLAIYFVQNPHGSFVQELSRLNWAPFAFGIVLVGLEAGWLYAYRAGWPVSTATVVQSAFLAVVLMFVGWLLYKEALTWNKLVGVAVCLVGLAFINLK